LNAEIEKLKSKNSSLQKSQSAGVKNCDPENYEFPLQEFLSNSLERS